MLQEATQPLANKRWAAILLGRADFAAAFGTLAISFWPYRIRFWITIEEAAAPYFSRAFMFWGAGLVVFPLMLLYTAISYSVFRGKVKPTSRHYYTPDKAVGVRCKEGY